MTLQKHPAMESVLCIVVDNNPIAGQYFSDPGQKSPDVLSQAGIARTYTYKQPATSSSATTPAAFYDVGTRMVAARSIGAGALRPAYGGWWGVPAAGADGECELAGGGSGFVSFRSDIAPTRCSVTRLVSAQTCEALSADRLLTELSIGASPQAVPATPAGYVQVALGDVLVADAATGQLTTPAAPATAIVSTFNAGSCSCSAAVVAVSYRVAYSATGGTVTSVTADVVVAPIAQTVGVCGTEPVSVPQTIAVTFVPDAASSAAIDGSFADSNAVPYTRSGNAGYFRGAPVAAGVLISQASGYFDPATQPLATDKLAIARAAPPTAATIFTGADNGVGTAGMGLTVRGPAADGSCVAYSAGAAAGTDAALPVPVTFGDDMAFACTLTLTPAQLQTLCGGSPAALLPYFGLGTSGVPGSTNVTAFTHVGIYGNADPFKTWQWQVLDVSTPTATATYDAVAARCDGLTTEVDIEFLTAKVGEKHNPQHRILAARVRYPTGSWAFTREDVRSTAPAVAQPFRLLTTVTWTEYNPQTTADYVPPAPPVIPPLPSDLFYPFVRSTGAADSALTVSGAATRGLSVIGSLLTLVAAALLGAAAIARQDTDW